MGHKLFRKQKFHFKSFHNDATGGYQRQGLKKALKRKAYLEGKKKN